MASSSTHDTGLELVLRSLWRTCNLRLRASNRHDDVDTITESFAEVLDVAFDDLISERWPPGPAGRHPEAVAYERQVIGIVWSDGARLKRSDKVAQAACALTEAWEELEKVGRSKEGKWFKKAGEFDLLDLVTL